MRAQGRLTSPEEFGQIVVRETPDGGIVRVQDVARIELGAQDYSIAGRLNGKPSAVIAVYQLPGSNAVEAAAGVKKLMAEMKTALSRRLDYAVALDTTRAVTEGMKEIVVTLVIAIVLVILVVYLFLQGWRATLIPLLAVPVSLIGTFVLLPAVRLFHQHAFAVRPGAGDRPGGGRRHRRGGRRGTPHRRRHGSEGRGVESDGRISGPVVGIALVLSAVFVPTAFIPGITGRLYQQFAVTIAISVILSAFNALTLSPALAALLLQARKRKPRTAEKILRLVQPRRSSVPPTAMSAGAGVLIRKTVVVVVLLVAFGVAAGFFGNRVPSSFLPDEDQGYVYVNLQLPNAASLERTDAVAGRCGKNSARVRRAFEYTTSVVGFSLLSFVRTSYNAFFFVTLKEWDERKTRAEQFQAIKAHLNQEFSKLPEGDCVRLLAAGHSGRRHLRRIHFHPRRPRRQRRAVPGRRI